MTKRYLKILFVLLSLSVLVACQSTKLPTEKYYQFSYYRTFTLEEDVLKVEIQNPLYCPLRVWLKNEDADLQARFNKLNPVILPARKDTLLSFDGVTELQGEVNFGSSFGDPGKAIKEFPLELPFPDGKSYRVIQGNNSNYTHNTEYNRYAVDFSLLTNDTICAATDGYVVGVIEGYNVYGKGEQWNPYANFITLYDPESGLFTQYVHLVKDGSFVSVGDQVKKGQAIGLTGLTGNTDIEHLHFNCLIPNESGLESIPHTYEGGYQSQELKKNDVIEK